MNRNSVTIIAQPTKRYRVQNYHNPLHHDLVYSSGNICSKGAWHYPTDKSPSSGKCSQNFLRYPPDWYLFGGWCYPDFEQPGSGVYCTDKFSVPLEWRDILTGHFLWAPAPNSSERLSIEWRKTKSVEISTTKTTNLSEGKYRRNQWEQNPRMQNKQTARMVENAREQVVVRLACD